MSFNFKNKTVLVTGGSKGIGSAISKAFFNSGANVYFTSRVKQKIIQKKNSFFKSMQVDFNDNESYYTSLYK